MPSNSLQEVVQAIESRNNFLLSAHISPEGDCVSSVLALDSLLGKIRKKAFVLCEDEIPEQLHFLDNGRWNTIRKHPAPYLFDNSIIADCPSLDRIGKVKDVVESKKVFVINIDHHISNKNFGDINFVDPHAAATGELIYDLFQAFKVPMSAEDLRYIYVSLSTDTGSFRYSNTTAKTHDIVADLFRHGLKTDKLNEMLYESIPRRKVELFRVFLTCLEFAENGAVAFAILRDEDLAKTGCAKIDLEGFVEYLRSIIGVQASFLICEQRSDSRVSFRSKGEFDVNKLAGIFGGGGHTKAAGCTIHVPVEEARQLILEQIRKMK